MSPTKSFHWRSPLCSANLFFFSRLIGGRNLPSFSTSHLCCIRQLVLQVAEQSTLLLFTQLISFSHLMGAIPADRVAHLQDGGYEAVEGPLQEAPLGPRVWLVAPFEERVEAAAAAAAGGTRSHRGLTIQLWANCSTVALNHSLSISFQQKKGIFSRWGKGPELQTSVEVS